MNTRRQGAPIMLKPRSAYIQGEIQIWVWVPAHYGRLNPTNKGIWKLHDIVKTIERLDYRLRSMQSLHPRHTPIAVVYNVKDIT
jgi:hypothetical protein